jgi:Mg-chelatase subunit ChlD
VNSVSRNLLSAAIAALILVPAVAKQQENCSELSVVVSAVTADRSPEEQLTASNIQGSISGKPVQIVSVAKSETPVRIIIAIDASGSMTKLGAQWRTDLDLADLLLNHLPANVPVGLVVFSGESEVALPPTTDRSAPRQQVDRLRTRNLRVASAIWDALIQTAEMFGNPRPGDTIYLISDGGDDASRSKADAVQKALVTRGIRLFTYAPFHDKSDRKAFDKGAIPKLVSDTGGTVIESGGLKITHQSKSTAAENDLASLESPLSIQLDLISHYWLVGLKLPDALGAAQDRDELNFTSSATDSLAYPHRLPRCGIN